jgi:hypothetical protein
MKLNCFLLAEFAAITKEMKVVIAGTFDMMTATVPFGTELPLPPGHAIAMTPCYLVAITECSISAGLRHQMRFRIVNGSGVPIVQETAFEILYEMNQDGRPLRNNLVIHLSGVALPGADDYVFELWHADDKTPLGEFTFSVSVTARPDPSA